MTREAKVAEFVIVKISNVIVIVYKDIASLPLEILPS